MCIGSIGGGAGLWRLWGFMRYRDPMLDLLWMEWGYGGYIGVYVCIRSIGVGWGYGGYLGVHECIGSIRVGWGYGGYIVVHVCIGYIGGGVGYGVMGGL